MGKSRKDAADLLGEVERAEYRHLAPLAHYVAADRPDIQYATGLLMRTLEEPTVLQRLMLERLGSYLKQNKELQWNFDYQQEPSLGQQSFDIVLIK